MKKLLVSVALLTFLFVGFFGMNLSMSKDTDGKMANCPLMNSSSSFCQMGIVEHISKWQQVLQAIPFLSIFFLLALGLLFIARSFYSRAYFSLSPPQRNPLSLYYKEHPDSNLFNNLILAFSDGILHPKIP